MVETKGKKMIRKVGDFEVREEWVEFYSSYMFVVYDRGVFHFQTYYLAEAMNYVRKMTFERLLDKIS